MSSNAKSIVFLLSFFLLISLWVNFRGSKTLTSANKIEVETFIAKSFISDKEQYKRLFTDLYEIIPYDKTSIFWVHLIKGSEIEVDFDYGKSNRPQLKNYEDLIHKLDIMELSFRPEKVIVEYNDGYQLILVKDVRIKDTLLIKNVGYYYLAKNELGELYIHWIR